MALLIIVELCVLSFCLNTLSAIRGYVLGEGLWSKAQRDASLELRLYANTGEERHYQKYLSQLKIPLGDQKERTALEKAEPDVEAAREGLLQGHNDAGDIDGMITLLLRFREVSYLKHTIYYWQKAESTLLELVPVADELHRLTVNRKLEPTKRAELVKKIDLINEKIIPYENAFSYTLGEGSRWLEGLVLKVLFTLALTVELTGILIAISISRNIRTGLNAIISGAGQLADGFLNVRIDADSNDEMGKLAKAFNVMADRLQTMITTQKTSENILRSFFNSTRACHILLAPNLDMIYFNNSAAKFAMENFNIQLKQGLPTAQYIQPTRLLTFRHNCEMAMQGELIETEELVSYENGKTVLWSQTFESARDENNEIIGVSYHVVDVTKRLEQEKEILSQNKSLKEIAYLQSHGMRRPVATILGLINVFELEDFVVSKQDLLLLREVAQELDEQIRSVITHSDNERTEKS